MTTEQYDKWLEGFRGWGSSLEADNDGELSAEDAVMDMAMGMVDFPCLHDGTAEAIDHLRANGAKDRWDIIECLADHLFSVAYKEDSDVY